LRRWPLLPMCDVRRFWSLLEHFLITPRPSPKKARPDRDFCRQEKENRVACPRTPLLIRAIRRTACNHCLDSASCLRSELRGASDTLQPEYHVMISTDSVFLRSCDSHLAPPLSSRSTSRLPASRRP